MSVQYEIIGETIVLETMEKRGSMKKFFKNFLEAMYKSREAHALRIIQQHSSPEDWEKIMQFKRSKMNIE